MKKNLINFSSFLFLAFYCLTIFKILTVRVGEPFGLPGIPFIMLGFLFFIIAIINLIRINKISQIMKLMTFFILISYPISCSLNPGFKENDKVKKYIQNDLKILSIELQKECDFSKVCKKIDKKLKHIARYDVGEKTFFIIATDNFDNFYILKGGVNVPLLYIEEPLNYITDFGYINEIYKNDSWQTLTPDELQNFYIQYKIDKDYYSINSKN